MSMSSLVFAATLNDVECSITRLRLMDNSMFLLITCKEQFNDLIWVVGELKTGDLTTAGGWDAVVLVGRKGHFVNSSWWRFFQWSALPLPPIYYHLEAASWSFKVIFCCSIGVAAPCWWWQALLRSSLSSFGLREMFHKCVWVHWVALLILQLVYFFVSSQTLYLCVNLHYFSMHY